MLLRVREAAERLNVSIAMVYLLCQQRRLPHVRIGVGRGAIRIKEEDLQQYLAGSTVGSEPADDSAPRLAAGKPFKHLDGGRLTASWQQQGIGVSDRKAAADDAAP